MIGDIHGDAWSARIMRDHERHAGLPTARWWCPYNRGPYPMPSLVTSAMLAEQRAEFARAEYRRVCVAGQARNGFTEDEWDRLAAIQGVG